MIERFDAMVDWADDGHELDIWCSYDESIKMIRIDNDDEEEAVGAIKLAGTKINVSYVAFRFYQLYQRDLQSYLESFLENDNWSDLNEALDKMKNF